MMTQDFQDVVERDRRAQAEQVARNEQAHKANVEIFQRMWLSLGSDVLKLDGSRHDQELMEARGLAMHRWSALLGMEQQIQRDAAALETRPKKRPAQHGDDRVPDRTIAEWDETYERQTKDKHVALAELRKLTERERAELESLTQRR